MKKRKQLVVVVPTHPHYAVITVDHLGRYTGGRHGIGSREEAFMHAKSMRRFLKKNGYTG